MVRALTSFINCFLIVLCGTSPISFTLVLRGCPPRFTTFSTSAEQPRCIKWPLAWHILGSWTTELTSSPFATWTRWTLKSKKTGYMLTRHNCIVQSTSVLTKASVWYEIRVLWAKKNHVKSYAMTLAFSLQTDIYTDGHISSYVKI